MNKYDGEQTKIIINQPEIVNNVLALMRSEMESILRSAVTEHQNQESSR